MGITPEVLSARIVWTSNLQAPRVAGALPGQSDTCQSISAAQPLHDQGPSDRPHKLQRARVLSGNRRAPTVALCADCPTRLPLSLAGRARRPVAPLDEGSH